MLTTGSRNMNHRKIRPRGISRYPALNTTVKRWHEKEASNNDNSHQMRIREIRDKLTLSNSHNYRFEGSASKEHVPEHSHGGKGERQKWISKQLKGRACNPP